MKIKILMGILASLLLAASSFAQDDRARLIQEALKPSPLQTNLERLTDSIGGRVPGTPAMRQAVLWATDALKAAGGATIC